MIVEGMDRVIAEPSRRSRIMGPVLWIGSVVLGSLVAFARLPVTAQGTIWAEDGGIFLRDALAGGTLLDVFAPYEGYLHVLPRVAAEVVVMLFPVDYFAGAMNFLSCVTVALIAGLVFHCSKAMSPNPLVRICWASITILVAPGPLETLGNFANVHWYLLWAVPWLLLKPAASRAEGVFLFMVAVFVALTEILSLMFIPLFLYRFKDKGHWPARAGLLIGLACQVATTLFFPRSPSSGYQVNPVSVVQGWFLNSSSALVFGDSPSIIENIRNFGALPIVLAALPFLAAFMYILSKGSRQHRLLAVVLVVASVGSWAATQVANPQRFFDYAGFNDAEWQTFFLSRYSTVPSMFLLALLPLAAAATEVRVRTAFAAVLSGFLVLQAVYFFPSWVSRQDGPIWAEGVLVARQACLNEPTVMSQSVPIAPRGWTWDKVEVSCTLLLR
ncbi:hypothetical protein QFZ30_001158 [Arthrobacter pascens]|uniref:hypothetical protein n=1 Tax=Arthrobacter pascens TaxID=1677 RepID=UPI00278D60AA|nr:hypothetical protein [Arthrobacter pascens]MDQ0677776.1 hypothetical protein [Arthrobacter pascens]